VHKARGGAMGWGLANVNVLIDGASTSRGEYGWDGTAGTIFWINPAQEAITILMTQSSPANPDQLRQRFKALIDEGLEKTRLEKGLLENGLLEKGLPH
jgi:CubicO group peptidase (beta-lactamase class C family)